MPLDRVLTSSSSQFGLAFPLIAGTHVTAGARRQTESRLLDGTRRCNMTPTVGVCVYCSQKIEEKEKSVNVPHLPNGVAHLACAQRVTIRTKSSLVRV